MNHPAPEPAAPERVRVVYLLDRLTRVLGGAERTVLTLAPALPRDRYEVWVCATRTATPEHVAALEAAGVRVIAAGRTRIRDLLRLRILWRLLRRERIDVLHSHMFGSNVWGVLLGRLAGVPVLIAHEHSWSYEGQPLRKLLDFFIGRAADAFVAVSRADARLMVSRERVPRDRIVLIPSAWVPRPATEIADLRGEYGIPADAPVIGSVAVLRRVKRLDRLIEAFATVLAEEPAAWLVIGGDGDDRERLEAAAREFGVEHRTVITGMRDDVETLWAAIDVAAMSSEREGTPVAALEAMAHGTPIVAPDVGGIPDVLAGGAGVLVPPGDVGALARELLALLRDPERREQTGAAGRSRASEYTLDAQIERCERLYGELLARPRARRRARRRAPRHEHAP